MSVNPTRRIGCKDCRLIEPQAGIWIEGRCPVCRKARGLVSNKIGRPRTRLKFTGKCEECGLAIEWLSADPRKKKRFCSRACNLKQERDKRGKVPGEIELRELYVKENLSTTTIAKMFNTDARTVNRALRRVGVQLRRTTVALECQIKGCQNRAKKIVHPINGSRYGTLCALHRYEHRSELATYYRKYRSSNANPAEKYFTLRSDG